MQTINESLIFRYNNENERLKKENFELKMEIAQQAETIMQNKATIAQLTESVASAHKVLDDIFLVLQDTEQTQEQALHLIREAREILTEPDALAPQFDADFRHGVDEDLEEQEDDAEEKSPFDKLREHIREQLQQPYPFPSELIPKQIIPEVGEPQTFLGKLILTLSQEQETILGVGRALGNLFESSLPQELASAIVSSLMPMQQETEMP